jgi:transcriptional regulator with XRE-family HTH domain
MNLGQRIKVLRKGQGLSQPALAERVGIAQQSLARIESNVTKHPRQLDKIAKVLGVTPNQLVYGDMSDVYGQVPTGNVPLLDWDEVVQWCIPDEQPLSLEPANRRLIPWPEQKNLAGKQFALQVKTDLMAAASGNVTTFPTRTIIIADPELLPIASGDYIIGVWEDAKEVIFRQYVVDGVNTYLRPLNPQYPLQEATNKFVPLAVVIAQINFHRTN